MAGITDYNQSDFFFFSEGSISKYHKIIQKRKRLLNKL